MPNNRPIFETERLLLIPTNLADAVFIWKVFTTPGALRFIGDRQLHSLEDATAFIRDRVLPHWEKNGYGNYTLIEKKSQQKVGVCGVFNREGLEHPDLGYAMLPAFEGLGYAKESSLRMMSAAKEHFGLSVLDGLTHPENERSIGLLKHLGFVSRGQSQIDGYDYKTELFRIHL